MRNRPRSRESEGEVERLPDKISLLLKSGFFIGGLCLLVSAQPAAAQDQATLPRLGGVYGGEYVIDIRGVENGEIIYGPSVETTGGRIVLPRRKGQRIRGTISLGLGLMDFDEPVRRVRVRRSVVKFSGSIRLVIRDQEEEEPFVGKYTAKARVSGGGERVNFRFNASRLNGGFGPGIQVLRGKFKTVR